MLVSRSRQDLRERADIRDNSIGIFNTCSQAFYSAPGKLAVDISQNVFMLKVTIERSGSQGINNMKIFCYDLMLARLWAEKHQESSFLIHDSTLFDGVDTRQVAPALELARSESEEHGFQYICMLNSDTIPAHEFSPGFSLDPFVRLTLTDRDPEGSLLGIRF